MASLISDDAVPLTKPVVMLVWKEWESISSQPRVLPFLRTSDLRKMISVDGVSGGSRGQYKKTREEADLTEMRIVGIVVIRGPEEGPDHTGALDGTEGETERPYHGRILSLLQRNVVWREGLVLLGVFLEAACPG